jgi:hypothetical protein
MSSSITYINVLIVSRRLKVQIKEIKKLGLSPEYGSRESFRNIGKKKKM